MIRSFLFNLPTSLFKEPLFTEDNAVHPCRCAKRINTAARNQQEKYVARKQRCVIPVAVLVLTISTFKSLQCQHLHLPQRGVHTPTSAMTQEASSTLKAYFFIFVVDSGFSLSLQATLSSQSHLFVFQQEVHENNQASWMTFYFPLIQKKNKMAEIWQTHKHCSHPPHPAGHLSLWVTYVVPMHQALDTHIRIPFPPLKPLIAELALAFVSFWTKTLKKLNLLGNWIVILFQLKFRLWFINTWQIQKFFKRNHGLNVNLWHWVFEIYMCLTWMFVKVCTEATDVTPLLLRDNSYGVTKGQKREMMRGLKWVEGSLRHGV